jgi:hypothetical protein
VSSQCTNTPRSPGHYLAAPVIVCHTANHETFVSGLCGRSHRRRGARCRHAPSERRQHAHRHHRRIRSKLIQSENELRLRSRPPRCSRLNRRGRIKFKFGKQKLRRKEIKPARNRAASGKAASDIGANHAGSNIIAGPGTSATHGETGSFDSAGATASDDLSIHKARRQSGTDAPGGRNWNDVGTGYINLYPAGHFVPDTISNANHRVQAAGTSARGSTHISGSERRKASRNRGKADDRRRTGERAAETRSAAEAGG